MASGNDILYFYGWWQLIVCTFAFAALMSIWWHLGRKRKDHGQVWLALSLLCWSISGVVEIYFTSSNFSNEYLLEGLRSVSSLFNSLFILLALPWFKYLPAQIESVIKSKYWHLIIGLPFLFSLLPTINKIFSSHQNLLISELDVYFAFLTLLFLGSVLWTSFRKRRLPFLAFLSLVCIGITVVAQLYKLTDADINLTLFSAIFKTCLIMIFFALALSWVKELSENILPDFSKLHLSLKHEKIQRGKIHYSVILNGIPGLEMQKVTLTRANYELLKKFVLTRINNTERWLEIKPKDVKGQKRLYEINDHNEIKRLLHSLLDGIFGPGSWTKEKHFLPLKETLFEMSADKPRNIKLRLLPSQITVQ